MNFVEDPLLLFNEDNHTYFYNEKRIPISVSKAVSYFFPKFDKVGQSQKIANKIELISKIPENQRSYWDRKYYSDKFDYHKKTAEDIQYMWDENGKRAANEGTEFHKLIEDYDVSKQMSHPPATTPYRQEFDNFLEYDKYVKHQEGWQYVASEVKTCFNHKKVVNIAGQVDRLMMRDGFYMIEDWKRCKPQTFSSKTQAKFPFQDMYDRKANKYAIQVNLYKFLLEHHYDIHIEQMRVVRFYKNDVEIFEIDEIPMEKLLKALKQLQPVIERKRENIERKLRKERNKRRHHF